MTILRQLNRFNDEPAWPSPTRPNPAGPWCSLTASFFRKYKRYSHKDVKFSFNLYWSFQFMLFNSIHKLNLGINYALFGNIAISVYLSSFFIKAFHWNGIENIKIKNIFFLYKNQFLGEKLIFCGIFCSFFQITS